ncbi:MAG: pyruvate kinase [Actinobacteria bacterium]|uniref:pyruvate kinase n=1 Tax=freshwater metagenome TaxID=449393 RepID=A0A6J6IYB1_9ZZZZ|nr:pyruvate kinase [Actinomycetota bacterium]MSZ52464.1 pyruvate kinase [Actinomycetota bacterium]MTA44216.1 pyruvate kinase [Actinomycetota bacterium]
MTRRTKIIASIGPASDDPRVLKGLMQSGMDIARINLSHESLELALERYHRIRAVASDIGRPIGILADLPGPKVRLGKLPGDGVLLVDGQEFLVTPGTGSSTAEVFQVDYEDLLTDIQEGDHLVFGDGAVQVLALGRQGDHLRVRVNHGGHLTGRPGIHIPSDRLRIATPTPEDLRFLDAFVEVGVDMVALSFVRSAHDVRRVGVEPAPRGPMVVAKIETRAAVQNLASIVEVADAVMVARGDLGSEFPIEELPHLQKEIIRRCIAAGRPVITATQMLESMIHSPSPTRAEASDVANAVFDGSSAVMLSGETAIGDDPEHVVDVMARIAARADEKFDYAGWPTLLASLQLATGDSAESRVTNAVTSAAQRAASEIGAAAILCISQSGFTVRSVARFRPKAKILGFSSDPRTISQLTLSWGTTPYHLEATGSADDLTDEAIALARLKGEIHTGDLVVVVGGSRFSKGRVTDTVRVIEVP